MSYGIGVRGGDVLVFKDLGAQISWKTVCIRYDLCPRFLWLNIWDHSSYSRSSSSSLQSSTVLPNPTGVWLKSILHIFTTFRVAFCLIILHYLKREFETFFVHRFSNDTMPFYRVFINSFHYWALGGILIAYFLFLPGYYPPSYPTPLKWICIGVFLFAEIMNFCCHLVLRSLRPSGSKKRGIPGVTHRASHLGLRLWQGVLCQLHVGDRNLDSLCGLHHVLVMYGGWLKE